MTVDGNPHDTDNDNRSESDSEDESSDGSSQTTIMQTMHSAVESGDINKVLQHKQSLTDREKLFLLEHSFVPFPHYSFPVRIISGCKRYFQYSWLHKHNGLVYSESANGGFCKYCVLFGKCDPRVKELGVLVNKPLTNFKKATEKLDEHFHGKQFHKLAVEDAMMFTKIQKNKALSIDQQLSTLRK